MIAKTEDEPIKRLNESKYNMKSKGMRVNTNKTNVMISGESQKVKQKAVRWPCGVCSKGLVAIHYSEMGTQEMGTQEVQWHNRKHVKSDEVISL